MEAFAPGHTAVALAETLFGQHNRWGKMPMTVYPHSYITEQVRRPHHVSSLRAMGFHERLIICQDRLWTNVVTKKPRGVVPEPMTNYDMAKPPGRTYKYYTGEPLWPFGMGLSYTSFDLSCSSTTSSSTTSTSTLGGGAAAPPRGSASPPADEQQGLPLTVSCDVKNTGSVDGDEVVMVYHMVR